jgi:hypothetical protein
LNLQILCPLDRRALDDALIQSSPLPGLTSGLRAGERLWIITEADRSATTLLLPEEY